MANTSARWEWPEPSTPTIIPDIFLSLCRKGFPAPLLSMLGAQHPAGKGRSGWPPGTLVLSPGRADCLGLS